MATDYGQDGKFLTFTAPAGGVTSGTGYIIGNTFVVAQADALVGEAFAGATEGVWSMPKQAALAIAEGANVYWDGGAGEADTTASNTFIGKCAATAAGGDANVSIKLTPGLTTASGAVAASLYDANTILAADTDDTPAALVVAEQTLVGRITGGTIDALTATEVRTLINVEDGAGVVDSTSVDAAGAVMESDYNAQTIMAATLDNTPAALTVPVESFIGRQTGGNVAAIAVTDESFVGRSATGVLGPQAVAVQSFVGRGSAGLGGIAVADESLVGRTAAGDLGGIAVGVSTIVGRAAAGNLAALAAGDVLTILGVEAAADVTDETNVLAALAVGATAKDVGGASITNVNLVDGRDVSVDGTALDTAVNAVAALGAENIDGHMAIPLHSGVAEAGTWTSSVLADGIMGLTRTAAAATEEYWQDIPAPARTTASKGIKPTGMTVNYTCNVALADDVRFELWKRTLAADGASPTAAVVFGDQDADYDANHNTAAKRADNTGAPELHRADITDAAGAAYLAADEQLVLRIIVDGDAGAGAVVSVIAAELLYSETLVDLV